MPTHEWCPDCGAEFERQEIHGLLQWKCGRRTTQAGVETDPCPYKKPKVRDWEEVDCPHAHECFEGGPYGKGAYEDRINNMMGGKPWHECHCMTQAERDALGIKEPPKKPELVAEPYLFYRSKHPFSNFYPAPFTVLGKLFPTSEHFFQAAKFWKTDPAWAEAVRLASSPGECAKMGRDRAHPIIPDWDEKYRDPVMRAALQFKFDQHPELQRFLLDTGDAYLIEDAPTDYYWGWGEDHSGQNKLGLMLMELRKVYQMYERLGFKVPAEPPFPGPIADRVAFCPQCGSPLEQVCQSVNSMLNAEQFESVKAGDYYCPTCPDNDRGKDKKCYWWIKELPFSGDAK